jgi:4-amino-4-deoxychorismate lyase
LQEKWINVNDKPYPAMYSSIFGGITLDPAMMVIPIDDHMVHRGHGVFDTAMLLDGYELGIVIHGICKFHYIFQMFAIACNGQSLV